jgi:DNA-binding NarL/FixJ family response regulator
MELAKQSRMVKRILLADDHVEVQKQLEKRLKRESDFDVVGVSVNSIRTLQEASTKYPDILLIDPMMRDGLGIATLRQICSALPVKIIVLTAFVDTELKLELNKMNIQKIFVKGILFSQLLLELRGL